MKLSLHPKKRKAFETKAPAAYVEVWEGAVSTGNAARRHVPPRAGGLMVSRPPRAVARLAMPFRPVPPVVIDGFVACSHFFQLEPGNGEILV
jgi:hypothetical protein